MPILFVSGLPRDFEAPNVRQLFARQGIRTGEIQVRSPPRVHWNNAWVVIEDPKQFILAERRISECEFYGERLRVETRRDLPHTARNGDRGARGRSATRETAQPGYTRSQSVPRAPSSSSHGRGDLELRDDDAGYKPSTSTSRCFFLAKYENVQDLNTSVDFNVWSFHPRVAAEVNKEVYASNKVVLLFAKRHSVYVDGYALVTKANSEVESDAEWSDGVTEPPKRNGFCALNWLVLLNETPHRPKLDSMLARVSTRPISATVGHALVESVEVAVEQQKVAQEIAEAETRASEAAAAAEAARLADTVAEVTLEDVERAEAQKADPLAALNQGRAQKYRSKGRGDVETQSIG